MHRTLEGVTLSRDEDKLLELVGQKEGWKDGYIVSAYEESSPAVLRKPFELRIQGKHQVGDVGVFNFSAQLMKAAIHCLVPWNCKVVADMTDYPDMARAGDWSAIRDTDEKKLWAIFDKFVVPQLNPPIQRAAGAYSNAKLKEMVKDAMKEIKSGNKKAKLDDWFVLVDAHGNVTLNVSYFTGEGNWKSSHSTAM